MIGSRSYLAGHWVEHGRLILAKVEIGEGSLLALDVLCSPGVVVGKKVTVKAGAVLGPNARIDDGASEVHRMTIARELLKLAMSGESTKAATGDLA